MGGSISGLQLFFLLYFGVLLAALIGAVAYRSFLARDASERFDELLQRRAALYEVLAILDRESMELSRHSDEELQRWLVAGPSSWPEGQALRDVDRELEILQSDLAGYKTPAGLKEAAGELTDSVGRTRRWIARVLGARSVAGVRTALAATAGAEAIQRLEQANDIIRQFAGRHGIKEPDSFYNGSLFYV